MADGRVAAPRAVSYRPVRDLLDDAQRQWPDVRDRKELLLRPARTGHDALHLNQAEAEADRRCELQRSALERLRDLVDTRCCSSPRARPERAPSPSHPRPPHCGVCPSTSGSCTTRRPPPRHARRSARLRAGTTYNLSSSIARSPLSQAPTAADRADTSASTPAPCPRLASTCSTINFVTSLASSHIGTCPHPESVIALTPGISRR